MFSNSLSTHTCALTLVVLVLLASQSHLQSAVALVVTSEPREKTVPQLSKKTGAASARGTFKSTSNARKSSTISLRIRSSQEAELDEISTLLATATMKGKTDTSKNTKSTKSNNVFNWNSAALQMLMAKSKFRTQLLHRLRAIKEGKKTFHRIESDLQQQQQQDSSSSLLHKDDCEGTATNKSMWLHDTFRSHLERAVKTSVERPTLWDDHNFALCPEEPSYLKHAMITVEDVTTQTVVGFCEVAMLPVPDLMDHHHHHHATTTTTTASSSLCRKDKHHTATPMIVNLVISPSHRRQGIASQLLRCIKTYVRRTWNQTRDKDVTELGLYVDMSNTVALSLYSKEGFEVHGSCEGQRWYLSQQLSKWDDRTPPQGRKYNAQYAERVVVVQ